MTEKKSVLNEEIPINLDLESIAGLCWLGVLGTSAALAAGYQAYQLFNSSPIADPIYQFASDLSQYFPIVNS